MLEQHVTKSSMSHLYSAALFPALGLVELVELLSISKCRQAIFILT